MSKVEPVVLNRCGRGPEAYFATLVTVAIREANPPSRR
jgi:hypothetical protein